MTKTEARAILACQAKVQKAIEQCLSKLSGQEKDYAEAYWAAHILAAMNGSGYGSAPIARAQDVLDV